MTEIKQDLLPRNVDKAVGILINLSQDLLTLEHKEHMSLVTLDHMRFANAQREKESLSLHYSQASEEFRGRLGAFRMADKSLIERLETLQLELQEISALNNNMINDLKRKTCATTQSVLFAAQEMGQQMAEGRC